MGLSLVNGIVSRHEGAITIRSDPGRGSSFTLRLPLGDPPAPEDTSDQSESAAVAPLRVLLVDDDPPVRRAVAHCLGMEGHEVESLSDPREALARATAVPFDLLITDSAMPGMRGEELAAEIKQTNPELPAILITGYRDALLRTGRPPQSIDVIVGKPVMLAELRQAIADVAG